MSNTMCSKTPEKFLFYKSGIVLGEMKILMQKNKIITCKTISFMWIWFANIYDDLHLKINPLISNIDLSFTQRATKAKILWGQHNLWHERKMEIFSTQIATYWWVDSLRFQSMEFKCLHHSSERLYSQDFPYLSCKKKKKERKKVFFVSYKLFLLKSMFNININE